MALLYNWKCYWFNRAFLDLACCLLESREKLLILSLCVLITISSLGVKSEFIKPTYCEKIFWNVTHCGLILRSHRYALEITWLRSVPCVLSSQKWEQKRGPNSFSYIIRIWSNPQENCTWLQQSSSLLSRCAVDYNSGNAPQQTS